MTLGREFDIIVRTLATEKTTGAVSIGKFYFEVVPSATKNDIKNAVQNIFGVVVESVNVMNLDGKVKRFRGKKGRRKSSKKAIVTLKEGQNINLDKLE